MLDVVSITHPGEQLWMLIVALALVTYLTRIGGHVVLSRFRSIHPRVEAALEAVPAAVLTTIFVPPALTNGLAEFTALVVAVFACVRLSPIAVLVLGLGVLVAMRQLGF